jgi:hypothetical protein
MSHTIAPGYGANTTRKIQVNKKTDVVECLTAFDHVGLLSDRPP